MSIWFWWSFDSYLVGVRQTKFLDCTGGEKLPSASLLHVQVVNPIQLNLPAETI